MGMDLPFGKLEEYSMVDSKGGGLSDKELSIFENREKVGVLKTDALKDTDHTGFSHFSLQYFLSLLTCLSTSILTTMMFSTSSQIQPRSISFLLSPTMVSAHIYKNS